MRQTKREIKRDIEENEFKDIKGLKWRLRKIENIDTETQNDTESKIERKRHRDEFLQ